MQVEAISYTMQKLVYQSWISVWVPHFSCLKCSFCWCCLP